MFDLDPISLALDPPRFVKTKRPARTRDVRPPVRPLPELNGRAPIQLDSWKRGGIDLAYARRSETDLIATYPAGSTTGTTTHFMPPSIPAFCVIDGEVTYAGEMAHSHAIIVDHGNGWATYYANLEHMFVTPTRRARKATYVKSGDALGFVGAAQPGGFKCLHFELWKSENNLFVDRDPTKYMPDWRLVPLRSASLTPDETKAAQAAA
jgi:hypothetical protein